MADRIYTRTGDFGETGLFGGQRVAKDDLRIEAYGDVDELNAFLGASRAFGPDTDVDAVLSACQNDLFFLGADLATPAEEPTTRGRAVVQRVAADRVTQLEVWIDGFEAELPPLRNFILPGGSPLSASLQLARAVCRRAERHAVAFARAVETEGELAVNTEVLRYLNRLSDLLFVLARVANQRHGVQDVRWAP